MDSESRQAKRAALRRDALISITKDVGGRRRLRRLMARSFGNRQYRAAKGLPEMAHMMRRGGLRK